MRRRARKCAGIRGYVGVHLGVHFRNVGVHWVLYPTPPATRQRQPCACQPLPQCTPWQARHKATAPAVAHTQQRSHIHKPPPHGPAAQLNPLGRTPQQSASAARLPAPHRARENLHPRGRCPPSTVHPFKTRCTRAPMGLELPSSQNYRENLAGCISRHSRTDGHRRCPRKILRGMTIFTGDTGDKLQQRL